jgi:hypothetical protein
MGKGTVEKFGLKAIVDTLDGLDVLTARDRLSAVVGASAVCLSDCRKLVMDLGLVRKNS